MLTSLKIKNFKGWADTGEIRMSPITLFFGANSSGKSSIGQFLMMLKQTAESSDRKAVFYPGGKNSPVQLGSYQEMVFGRDPSKKIGFEYRWTLPETLSFRDPISGQDYLGDSIRFDAQAGLDRDQGSLILDHLKYTITHQEKSEPVSLEMVRSNGKRVEYNVHANGYKLSRSQGRPWSPRTPYRFYGIPDEVVAYHQNADFVQLLNLRHEEFFRSIFYLGPLRTGAERLYSWTGIEPESVGNSGENTVAAILAARKRKINLGPRMRTKPFEGFLASKLLEMNLIENFKVNAISKQRQEYEVKVRTVGSKDWVDLPDVGFGVSQVLPVLVQCFYAPRHSIIIMEQPEIHLHPSAQSALADVMIDVINSRENALDRNIQLVIETHSEHFLRRLQRRIAEDKLSQDKVSAYFANITQTPARLEPLEIDMFGNIRNWPENFFGDEMADITGHAKAAMRKKMNSRPEQMEASE